MMLSQLLTTLPEDVRIWVTERKPKTSKEAGQLAEDYLPARSTTSTLKPSSTKQENTTGKVSSVW